MVGWGISHVLLSANRRKPHPILELPHYFGVSFPHFDVQGAVYISGVIPKHKMGCNANRKHFKCFSFLINAALKMVN